MTQVTTYQKQYVGFATEKEDKNKSTYHLLTLDGKKMFPLLEMMDDEGTLYLSLSPLKKKHPDGYTHTVYQSLRFDKYNTIKISIKKQSYFNDINRGSKGIFNLRIYPVKEKESNFDYFVVQKIRLDYNPVGVGFVANETQQIVNNKEF